MIVRYVHQGETYTVELERLPDEEQAYRAVINGQVITFRAVSQPNGSVILVLDGERITTHVERDGNDRFVSVNGDVVTLSIPEKHTSKRRSKAGGGGGDLTAQMPGQVREIMVAEGDTVERGQPILLLEAMKMEIRVTAGSEGTVKRLLVKQGDVVERGQVLAEIG